MRAIAYFAVALAIGIAFGRHGLFEYGVLGAIAFCSAVSLGWALVALVSHTSSQRAYWFSLWAILSAGGLLIFSSLALILLLYFWLSGGARSAVVFLLLLGTAGVVSILFVFMQRQSDVLNRNPPPAANIDRLRTPETPEAGRPE
jgi:hypothetical protein